MDRTSHNIFIYGGRTFEEAKTFAKGCSCLITPVLPLDLYCYGQIDYLSGKGEYPRGVRNSTLRR